MLTSRSPRTVMRAAYALARETLPNHTSKFSRHDFTLRQLFACLVLREHQGLSYRATEALLRDTPNWCHDIGMRKVPDHNTLCRAFRALNVARRNVRLLDRLTNWFAVARDNWARPWRSIARCSRRTIAVATTSDGADITHRCRRRRRNTRPTRVPTRGDVAPHSGRPS